MHNLTNSRVMSDQTSSHVAKKYLEDDILKSFPTPKIHLGSVDVEFVFAVGALSDFEKLIKLPEIQENLIHRFRALLLNINRQGDIPPELLTLVAEPQYWNKETDKLCTAIESHLATFNKDRDMLIHAISVTIENGFYRSAHRDPSQGVLDKLKQFFSKKPEAQTKPVSDNNTDKAAATINNWLHKQVTEIFLEALPPQFDATNVSQDLNILVGAEDLEHFNKEKLHRASINFTSDDRKWVANTQNGQKIYHLSK